jgi:hypothetical protein
VILLVKIIGLKAVFNQPFEVWGRPSSVELRFVNLTEDSNDEAFGQEYCVPAELLTSESRTEVEKLLSGNKHVERVRDGNGEDVSLVVMRNPRKPGTTIHLAFEVDPRSL